MFEGYNGPILPQDFRVIYYTMASTPQGIGALIEFLTTKLDRIVNEIIKGEQVATTIYSLLASRVARDEEIQKVLKVSNLLQNINQHNMALWRDIGGGIYCGFLPNVCVMGWV